MDNNNLFRLIPLVIGLLAIGGMLIRGCQQGPFGRSQVVALTPAEEARLGEQAFAEVLSKSDVVRDGPMVDAVRRVGKRLSAAAENEKFLRAVQLKPQKFDWEFRVIRSKSVNAFCLPGGKVVVYTGILPIAENDGGLATVMGHEIGHALAHHGAERMAQQKMVQYGQLAVAGSISDLDPRKQREVMALLGAGAQFGFLLKYSRQHESEADRLGLVMMAVAGYDPRQAVAFWQRMEAKAGGKSPPEFASTHPSHETRIRDIEGWLPEAMKLFNRSDVQSFDRPLPGR